MTINEGIKYDDNKLQWSLLPWKELESVVKVLQYGANKYAPDNWQKISKERYIDSLLRHVTAYMQGEKIDEESGLGHLEHAICNLLFVMWHDKDYSEDREKAKIKQNKQLTLNEYQLKASETAIYPKGSVKDNELPWMYPVLLLPSEVGELLSHFQKAFRDKNGELTNVELIKKELGDILWSISEIARQLGLSLEDVAITNIEKLQSRKERGKIGGSGDKR